MKEIKAYIRRECLDGTVNALAHLKDLTGVSLSAVTGFGRSRGRLRFVDFDTHVKLETVCRDQLASGVVDVIRRHACTGHRGDGKIFVTDVAEAVRIENGKTNESCI